MCDSERLKIAMNEMHKYEEEKKDPLLMPGLITAIRSEVKTRVEQCDKMEG